MPRAKTGDDWIRAIYEAKGQAPGLGAAAIYSRLKEVAKQGGRDDYPGLRTVGRILQAYNGLPEQERAQYRLFSWPESMELEAGSLPWEAARVGLQRIRDAMQ